MKTTIKPLSDHTNMKSVNKQPTVTATVTVPYTQEYDFVLIDVPEELLGQFEMLGLFDNYLSAEDSNSSAWEDTTGSYD